MGSLVFLRKVEKLVGDSAGDRRELVPLSSSVRLCHTKGILGVGGPSVPNFWGGRRISVVAL